MSTLFATLLILHILFGLAGVIYSFRVTFLLLKKEIIQMTIARSAYLAFASYLISWVAGGWYYWKYYGSNVKPTITSGDFPWAHIVFMESKEHIFLFLPFATLALALTLSFTSDVIITNSKLKTAVILLSLAITALAIIVTLSGVLISGGAR